MQCDVSSAQHGTREKNWNFDSSFAAVCFCILLTQLSDRASTVSGKSILSCEVIIIVTRIMGHGSTCTDPWPMWPIQESDPFDPLTRRPIACSAVYIGFIHSDKYAIITYKLWLIENMHVQCGTTVVIFFTVACTCLLMCTSCPITETCPASLAFVL